MTGSACKRWTFWVRAKAYVKGRGLGKGGQSDDGKRFQAMDVFVSCDSLFIGEGFREGEALGFSPDWRLADCSKIIYIYIYIYIYIRKLNF